MIQSKTLYRSLLAMVVAVGFACVTPSQTNAQDTFEVPFEVTGFASTLNTPYLPDLYKWAHRHAISQIDYLVKDLEASGFKVLAVRIDQVEYDGQFDQPGGHFEGVSCTIRGAIIVASDYNPPGGLTLFQ